MVIVILGILSAFALPRFSNMSEEAQLAQAQGIAGAMKVSVELVQTVFQSKGFTTRTQNLQGFGSGIIDTNNIGFPIGTNKGNGNENIGQGNTGCVSIWNELMDSPPSVSLTNNADYQAYRHTSSRVCSYVYRRNGDLGNQNTGQLVIKYDSRDGSVVVCGARADIPAC